MKRAPVVFVYALIFAIALFNAAERRNTADALPIYSRQYNVPCALCHTIAPRLNHFGYAFQANYFNLPGGDNGFKPNREPFPPFSTLTTFSYEKDVTGKQETAAFRAFELYFTAGLGVGKAHQGGYFIDLTAASSDDSTSNGNLEDAYVSVPVLGNRGQWALTVGQSTPLMFQYDPVNSLTDALPFAFTEGTSDFALAGAVPLVRLDYFNNRGRMSADGTYFSVGMPFHGHIELTRNGTIREGNGVFAHAFRRWGYSTAGLIGYLNGNDYQAGLIGTVAPARRTQLTAYGIAMRDSGNSRSYLGTEIEVLASHTLALTGRAEWISGSNSEFASVEALTWVPLKTSFFRLTLENRQRRADRGVSLFIRLQY